MPVSVAARIFSRSGIVSFAIASRSPDSTVLNGSTLASSGLALTRAGTRSRQYTTWLYIGCSTHSVPSWSKVAMRSSGGTNLELALSVVAFTKSTIACFAAPSFHEGSGSRLRRCRYGSKQTACNGKHCQRCDHAKPARICAEAERPHDTLHQSTICTLAKRAAPFGPPATLTYVPGLPVICLGLPSTSS